MRKSALAAALLLTATPALAEEVGECRFDRDALTFAGTPVEQATCLLRKVELLGEKKPQPLPAVIARLLSGESAPTAAQKAAALVAFPQPYRDYAATFADLPLAKTAAGLPTLYFVIHDTSTPFLGSEPFPRDLDNDWKVNDFTPYMNGSIAPDPVAHIFLSRYGQIWAGHEFSEGWRATKLESRIIGPAARGRFVHIETVQPRRALPGFTGQGHTEGPLPGFSKAQYRQLAALYVYTSARAGRWLIPGFHATVDAGIPDAHDDPQHFELGEFARELERLVSAHQPGP